MSEGHLCRLLLFLVPKRRFRMQSCLEISCAVWFLCRMWSKDWFGRLWLVNANTSMMIVCCVSEFLLVLDGCSFCHCFCLALWALKRFSHPNPCQLWQNRCHVLTQIKRQRGNKWWGQGEINFYYHWCQSKVVSTHRTGTHPEQPLPTGYKGIPFIIG